MKATRKGTAGIARRAKPGSPAGATDSYHHGSLRLGLLRAARGLLEEEGYDALTLRAAARRAGVSQAAPYHHFADKTALLDAVAAEGFRELRTAMLRQMTARPDPGARLTAAGYAYVEFAIRNPAVFKRMFSGALARVETDSELALASAAAYELLREAVAATRTERGMEPASNREDLASWALVHGLATLFNEGAVDPGAYGAKSMAKLTMMILERSDGKT